jgi:hypothetical protein
MVIFWSRWAWAKIKARSYLPNNQSKKSWRYQPNGSVKLEALSSNPKTAKKKKKKKILPTSI